MTNSAAVTRTSAAGQLLFVCKHCDESIGYPTGSPLEKLVHFTTGEQQCVPTTSAEKKLVELARVKQPSSIANSLIPFNEVVRELVTFEAEPTRSPSGKAYSNRGCKNCGQDIWWDGSQWRHWTVFGVNGVKACDGDKVAKHLDSK